MRRKYMYCSCPASMLLSLLVCKCKRLPTMLSMSAELSMPASLLSMSHGDQSAGQFDCLLCLLQR